MRIININFNQNPAPDSLILGVRGEHNNTKLVITPPTIEGADYYRIIFNNEYSKAFYNSDLIAGKIEMLLESRLTNTENATIALNAYDINGSLLAKTPTISGFIFLPAAETDIEAVFGNGVVEDLETRLHDLEEAEHSAAISPVVSVAEIADGYRITITDAEHDEDNPLTFDIMNGQDGSNGQPGSPGPQGIQGIQGVPGPAGSDGSDGEDGYSPAVTITEITGGHKVNITDATHPDGIDFNVMDGAAGSQGPQGIQGPAGPAGQSGSNGSDGQDGADGISPEVTIEEIEGGHTVTITDAEHPDGQSFDVMDGIDGDTGASYYPPAVEEIDRFYVNMDAMDIPELHNADGRIYLKDVVDNILNGDAEFEDYIDYWQYLYDNELNLVPYTEDKMVVCYVEAEYNEETREDEAKYFTVYDGTKYYTSSPYEVAEDYFVLSDTAGNTRFTSLSREIADAVSEDIADVNNFIMNDGADFVDENGDFIYLSNIINDCITEDGFAFENAADFWTMLIKDYACTDYPFSFNYMASNLIYEYEEDENGDIDWSTVIIRGYVPKLNLPIVITEQEDKQNDFYVVTGLPINADYDPFNNLSISRPIMGLKEALETLGYSGGGSEIDTDEIVQAVLDALPDAADYLF